MPYITASIIMQLLGVVIPKLEQWQQEGQVGQKKITQWTRYVTVGLALIQSTGFVFALHQGKSGLLGFAGFQGTDMIPDFDAASGRAHRPHLDRRYRDGDVAGRAHHPTRDRQRHVDPDLRLGGVAPARRRARRSTAEGSKFQFVTIIGIGIAMIVGIVFVESGQRRIPVQFAKRVVGRRMYGGQSTYIPLKVNQSGVIPVIFASSILSFPALIASALGDNWTGFQKFVNDNLVNHQGWFYIGFYTLLIIFFAYFYTAIAFNPPSRPTSSASRVGSSRASGPGRRPRSTSPRC